MEIEFHYWITGVLAHASGFTEEEANIIATSSQWVAENDLSIEVVDKSTHEIFKNYTSQVTRGMKPKPKMSRIFVLFHYLPGDENSELAERHDGRTHHLNVTPNSANSIKVMQNAFDADETSRLYRIGIASHVYADCWSHQNFVGVMDDFNRIGFFKDPTLGHLQAGSHPDRVQHRWMDDRLRNPKVDNGLRMLSAAYHLFQFYLAYLSDMGIFDQKKKPVWEDVEPLIQSLVLPSGFDEQAPGYETCLQKYQKLAPWLPIYDQRSWFEEAIEENLVQNDLEDIGKTRLYKTLYCWKQSQKKENTHWYQFQKAIEAYEKQTMEMLRPLLEKQDIPLF